MERTDSYFGMLEITSTPVFCVKNGLVSQVNEAARKRMVEVGTPVDTLIVSGKREYTEDFNGGCLYLTVSIRGLGYGATVFREDDTDIFVLDMKESQEALQALALAAQQLREPLHSIMTNSDSLFRALDADDAAQEKIARINRGLFQVLRMIGNMSDAASFQNAINSGKRLQNAQSVFSELFQKAGAMLEQMQITLQFTNLSAPVFCLLDVEKLERAVYNILSNSAKYVSSGGHIDARVSVSGSRVVLTITDNGPGIPESLRSSVFTRYLREPAIEDGRSGIGLGMLMVRSAAAAHSGAVLIDQPEKAGTRITMTLLVEKSPSHMMRSPIMPIDYAGGHDHSLIELSENLPVSAFKISKNK